MPSVVQWNDEFTTPSGVRGTKKWTQYLKNTFVYLNRLKDPWEQQNDWKHDMSIAANETVASFCPNWMSNSKHRDMYNSINAWINGFTNGTKSNPRQIWLSQKAYAWLKWLTLQHPQNTTWYPALAIQVAYELFLSGGSGKFESFMNYLKKKKNQPKIEQLIIAHESMRMTGSCWMVRYATLLDHCHLCYAISMRLENMNTKRFYEKETDK